MWTTGRRAVFARNNLALLRCQFTPRRHAIAAVILRGIDIDRPAPAGFAHRNADQRVRAGLPPAAYRRFVSRSLLETAGARNRFAIRIPIPRRDRHLLVGGDGEHRDAVRRIRQRCVNHAARLERLDGRIDAKREVRARESGIRRCRFRRMRHH